MVTAALTLTLVIVFWSLWVRRYTWRARWETAGTLCICFQGLALVLTFPILSPRFSTWLYEATGLWNLEDFVGHWFFIAAAGCTVYHAMSRLDWDTAAKFRTWVYYPIAAAFIVGMVLFAKSKASHVYHQDLFDWQPGPWFTAYWIVVCLTVIYLLGFTGWILTRLWQEPSFRQMICCYWFGVTVGISVCAGRIAVVTTGLRTPAMTTWFGICVGVAGFASAFGYSWQQKQKHLRAVLRPSVDLDPAI